MNDNIGFAPDAVIRLWYAFRIQYESILLCFSCVRQERSGWWRHQRTNRLDDDICIHRHFRCYQIRNSSKVSNIIPVCIIDQFQLKIVITMAILHIEVARTRKTVFVCSYVCCLSTWSCHSSLIRFSRDGNNNSIYCWWLILQSTCLTYHTLFLFSSLSITKMLVIARTNLGESSVITQVFHSFSIPSFVFITTNWTTSIDQIVEVVSDQIVCARYYSCFTTACSY